MIAHRRGRVIVIPDDVDPYPGLRRSKPISPLPRAARLAALLKPAIIRDAEPCRIA